MAPVLKLTFLHTQVPFWGTMGTPFPGRLAVRFVGQALEHGALAPSPSQSALALRSRFAWANGMCLDNIYEPG